MCCKMVLQHILQKRRVLMRRTRPLCSAATTVVLLLWLIVGCAGRGGSYVGQQGAQPDDVDNKAETPQGAQGKIAFESFRRGNGDIYTIKADGTDPVRLTDHPAIDGDPTWSPDGGKIAFVTDRNGDDDIYAMNADGTGAENLTDS